ncbi:hypothetical protein HYPSUDRAFT_391704 [Hypholoma sublateritium FD-334 SS-4]|uniref:Uncharacterized protein n=1 Tax=Hypholoma sublateritium (strain FD-334 SS-4) TaxID=945553 RepID=A0A0D2NF83_HYPSF|nr:hypothetical protein HYPSUDRAFT_391704 [Hypholoma sublateritium FD-334 SS-4]
MPECATSTLIHMLDNDTLLHIFESNADMFSDPFALHTTRIASQVCHRWRDLMLDTPALWAKLIDLDRISNSWSSEWRTELIRRSGAAPLWIRTHLSPSTEIIQFLFDVITGNWHRIQKLIISCCSCGFSFCNTMLFFPAPQLDEIDVPMEMVTIRAEDLRKPIFADHAPFLRRVSLRQYALDHRAPWFGQLYALNIGDRHNVHDALTLLSATHNLRELTIDYLTAETISTPFPTVSLPRLKLLDYTGRPQAGAKLLDHILIPSDCLLSINIPFVDNGTETKIYLALVDVFARQTQFIFQSHPIDSISLDYFPNDFITLMFKATLPVECLFNITISLRGLDAPVVDAMILDRIKFQELSYITNIRLVAEDPLRPCFGSFLSRLTSVHTILTERETLQLLTDLKNDMNSTNEASVVFPTLSVIDLYTTPAIPDNFSVDAEAVALIMSRLRNGHPITTLNLTVEDMEPFHSSISLDALDEIEGLKVTYKLSQSNGIYEYICGSGEPARLIDEVQVSHLKW